MGENVYKKHQEYVRSLILYSAQESNILPVTSVCNVSCVFCSHHQNPPGVEAFRIGHRTIDEIKETLDFMERSKPVVIGESVTRIMEGEPFTHPQIRQILELVHSQISDVQVQITTNGTFLEQEMVDFLADLGRVTINLSLNSARLGGREMLMRDSRAKIAVESPILLGRSGVKYHGSIVAMPWLTGWDDLKDTINYLEQAGAQTVRVFLPGYTRLAEARLRFDAAQWVELKTFISKLRQSLKIPLTIEPQLQRNFCPEVAGVIKDSPAKQAGLCTGDIILKVEEKVSLSRVQVFTDIFNKENPNLKVLRKKQEFYVQLIKELGKSSGLVMEYDLEPEIFLEMAAAARKKRAQRVLVLTSFLAGDLIKLGLKRFFDCPAETRVKVVKSRFFGGSVMCAGLLVVSDFAGALRESAKMTGLWPDLILLPGLAFDPRGRDLTGRSYLELEEEFGCPVMLL